MVRSAKRARGIAACFGVVVFLASASASLAQTSTGLPRIASGKPNLNGIWQVANAANWDLQTHGPSQGPAAFGALLSVPPGIGVVEGGEIPYLPKALEQRNKNRAARWTDDPEIKCYMPGVPRATYLPHPFQIVQSPTAILISYQFGDAARPINMGKPSEAPVDSWMGWSNGRWEGDTLVIDVKGFNDQTWLDRSGNYHSDALHVVERYTLANANQINYEATLEDTNVFSRPWKIAMPVYKHVEKNARLMEFKCAEFTEEMLYGHLRRVPSAKPISK
ncbi:MAG: hypothetical protein ABL967_08605 [Bryobacteraceae bacterium]